MITQPVRLQSILVPLDGSEPAEQALPIAQAIAERAAPGASQVKSML